MTMSRLLLLTCAFLCLNVNGKDIPAGDNRGGQHAADHHHHKFGSAQDMDESHIKLHLNNTINVDRLEQNHKRFYYFNLHNLNKDMFLDGLEIGKPPFEGLTHSHDGEPLMPMSDQELESMVDSVLSEFDRDGNGLVDYAEYLEATKGLVFDDDDKKT